MFVHVVRGPLKVLRDAFLSEDLNPQRAVLNYVSQLRERLHEECTLARASLSLSKDDI